MSDGCHFVQKLHFVGHHHQQCRLKDQPGLHLYLFLPSEILTAQLHALVLHYSLVNLEGLFLKSYIGVDNLVISAKTYQKQNKILFLSQIASYQIGDIRPTQTQNMLTFFALTRFPKRVRRRKSLTRFYFCYSLP